MKVYLVALFAGNLPQIIKGFTNKEKAEQLVVQENNELKKNDVHTSSWVGRDCLSISVRQDYYRHTNRMVEEHGASVHLIGPYEVDIEE